MNKKHTYLKNVGSRYQSDIQNPDQEQKSAEFWHRVGYYVPHVSIGWIVGTVIGTVLAYWILWPFIKAIFGPLFKLF